VLYEKTEVWVRRKVVPIFERTRYGLAAATTVTAGLLFIQGYMQSGFLLYTIGSVLAMFRRDKVLLTANLGIVILVSWILLGRVFLFLLHEPPGLAFWFILIVYGSLSLLLAAISVKVLFFGKPRQP
jgi:hypothetical protein